MGALVFGLLGPIFGGGPIILLIAIGGGLSDASQQGALQGVVSCAGVLAVGGLVAVAVGGLPGLVTGLLRSAYCRRLDPTACMFVTLAIGVVVSVACPLAIYAADRLHAQGAGGGVPRSNDGLGPGVLLIFGFPPLWAVPACESLLRRKPR